MEQIEDLQEDINYFLKKHNLPVIEQIPSDFVFLYLESLKRIWQNKNILVRDHLSIEVNKFFNEVIEKGFLDIFIDKQKDELDKQFPPQIEINELYENILDEYNNFIKIFTDSGIIDIKKLDLIIKRLLLIIDNHKNAIISRIIFNSDKYDYLTYHGINSAIIASIGGKELNLEQDELIKLNYVSLLHDLGMTKIPEKIINKKEKLSDEEYEMIKNHPIIMYKILNEINNFDTEIVDAIVQHHEREDSTGYPKKLFSNKVNKYAKIISIADSFESQISYRVYKKSKNGHYAIKEVLHDSKNKYDPNIMKVFLKTFSIYPPGTIVQLNNNSIGIVISINSATPLRPQIKIIIDEYGDKAVKEILKDLNQELNLFILRVIKKDEY